MSIYFIINDQLMLVRLLELYHVVDAINALKHTHTHTGSFQSHKNSNQADAPIGCYRRGQVEHKSQKVT